MLDIEAIKKREQAATPGPWSWAQNHCNPYDETWYLWLLDSVGQILPSSWVDRPAESIPAQPEFDWDFIAHARTDIPALLDELERTRAAAKALRKMVKETKWFLLERDEYPTISTQDEWNDTIQKTDWLEDLK